MHVTVWLLTKKLASWYTLELHYRIDYITTLSTSRFLSLEQIITNLVTTPDLFMIGITYLLIL